MLTTHILGYPRIGAQRELKHALEAFWNSNRGGESLQEAGRNLRASNWTAQEAAGLGFITAGDFSFYDHMLDHAVLLGCVPSRFGFATGRLELEDYFALARGSAQQPAMEMTKWFDTNYHYLVPELEARTPLDGHIEPYLQQVRKP